MANELGMSRQNLDYCLKNNTMQPDDLYKLSKIVDVPLSYFFEESETSLISEPEVSYGNKSLLDCEHQKELLEQELAHKNEMLRVKEEMIELLKKKLG